jgi:acetyltransferase
LATDALIESQGELAQLSPSTLKALDLFLPPAWSRGNPVDILGDADPERYVRTLEVIAKDSNIDGLLTILTPQAMSDPTATARGLTRYATVPHKPVLASWMGGETVKTGEHLLARAGIATFAYPDTAARIFTSMWRLHYNLQALYETPYLLPWGEIAPAGHERALAIIAAARSEGRTTFTEVESKQILSAYGIPTVETHTAATENDAAAIAATIGFPVAIKLHSKSITHKTEVGGVQLNLTDEGAVRRAFREIASAVGERVGAGHFQGVSVQPMIKLDGYELIIGSSLDWQFGPVLLFGTGGQLVEVFKDRALALPPLNTTLARRMMEQTKILTALKGVRGRAPVDLAALEQLLVRFSHLVVEQPWIKEIDINPLLASPEQLVALDARIIIHGPDVRTDDIPALAIRPYPVQYVSRWTAKDGTSLTLRPIRPEDEPLVAKFHGTLSERSVSHRYFHAMTLGARTAHERLTRICFVDYSRELVLVAERADLQTGEREIIGIGRLSKVRGTNEAEFALLVSDGFQGRGLGTAFLDRLVTIGRSEKIERICGDILPGNVEMKHICKKLGFQLTHVVGDSTIRASIEFS